MLKISPLFSGSRGNCTLIQSNKVNILLDLGYNYRSIVAELIRRSLAPSDVDAIIITHEHSDHVKALNSWAAHTSTPIYAPHLIADYVAQTQGCVVNKITCDFVIGDVTVEAYECSHDARSCYGYRFCCGNHYFASVTDTGCVTEQLVDFLSLCSAVMLESNHDVDMLLEGAYPYPLKKRILSNVGHLSNAQAGEVLSKLIGKNPSIVILAHLSENNNTRELAFNSAVNTYASNGLTEGKDVTVYVADQYHNDITICLQ